MSEYCMTIPDYIGCYRGNTYKLNTQVRAVPPNPRKYVYGCTAYNVRVSSSAIHVRKLSKSTKHNHIFMIEYMLHVYDTVMSDARTNWYTDVRLS